MAELIKNYDNGSSIKVVYSYSQNASKNQSTLTMTLYVKRDAYGPSWNTKCNAYIQVDGAKAMTYTGSFNIGTSWVKIGSTVSKTITHSADGSKTVSITGFFDSLGLTSKLTNLTVTGSVKLTTIPRASSISSISGSTIGSPVTVNINRQVSSFTHKVYYSFGDTQNYLIDDNVATSVTFTPSMNDCKYLPNATKGTGTIRVDTYSGSTKIGSASKSFTLNVPASVVPTFTGITFTRVDGTVPTSWGVYVKTKSKVKATISGATGAYGSTIKSYSISGGGYSGTASSLTTGFLNTAGTITFTAKITDSRGRTATKNASITVIDYSAPTITSVSAYRCNASGTSQDDGAYVALTAKFSGASVSGKNTISGKYRYQSGSGAWSGLVALTSGTKKVVSGISAESTYTFEVQVSDAFTTITQEITVNSAKCIMDFKAGGNGIAFGKVAEEADTLDCEWIAHFRKSLYFDNSTGIYGYAPDGNAVLAFEPQSADGNVVIGRALETAKARTTYVLGGSNVVLGFSGNRFYPYFKAGHSVEVTLHTAGYITSSGTTLYFTVPVDKPLVGVKVITASSLDGFLVRQDNKYLYGSAASTFVKPKTMTVYYRGSLLQITAVFGNSTNVTNNASAGIYWNGKLTFS